jgi:hypothetical protein
MKNQAKAIIDFIVLLYIERNAGLDISSENNQLKNYGQLITVDEIISKINERFKFGISKKDKKRLVLLPYLFTIGNGRRSLIVEICRDFYPVDRLGFVYVDFYNILFYKKYGSKILNYDYTLNTEALRLIYDSFQKNGNFNNTFIGYKRKNNINEQDYLKPIMTIERTILLINKTYDIEILTMPVEELTGYSIDVTPLRFIYDTYKVEFKPNIFKSIKLNKEVTNTIKMGIKELSFVFKPIPRIINVSRILITETA